MKKVYVNSDNWCICHAFEVSFEGFGGFCEDFWRLKEGRFDANVPPRLLYISE